VYDLETNSLEALTVFASYVGFQHWWSEGMRSTWTYGFVNVDNLEIQTPDSLDQPIGSRRTSRGRPSCESTSSWSISPERGRTARAGFPTSSSSAARFDSDGNESGPNDTAAGHRVALPLARRALHRRVKLVSRGGTSCMVSRHVD
ncbi:MAG: hypothetical protein ACRD1X_16775, partial [Vicinamibacteria bacterium]